MSDRTPGENAEPDQQIPDSDRLEGSYTEVDGEAPHIRGIHGEYTRTEGAPDDEDVVGDYVSTEEHPHTHDPSERPGKYVRSEPPKPHPGMHHVD